MGSIVLYLRILLSSHILSILGKIVYKNISFHFKMIQLHVCLLLDSKLARNLAIYVCPRIEICKSKVRNLDENGK